MRLISKNGAEARLLYKDQEKYMVTAEEIEEIRQFEQYVIDENVSEIERILGGRRKPRFLTRALGIACALGNLEIVKCMVSAGVSFKYEYNKYLDKPLLKAYKTNRDIYVPQYEYYMTENGVNVSFPPIHVRQNWIYFGEDLAKKNIALAPEYKRKEIILYLIENEKKVKFDISEMLFHFLINGFVEVGKVMIEKGICLSKGCIGSICDSRIDSVRGEWMAKLSTLTITNCISAFGLFCELTQRNERKIVITDWMMLEDDYKVYRNVEVIKYFYENTDVSRIKWKDLIKKLIVEDNVESVAFLFDQPEIILKAKEIDQFLQLALDNNCIFITSWLMDYKKKHIDVAEEEKKKERKLLKELTEAPGSASALKKIWTIKTIGESCLQINGYKGGEKNVVIPGKIGRSEVVAIGKDAFSPWALKIDEDLASRRTEITSVVIPNSVKHIDDYAFRGCKKLKTIRVEGELDTTGFLDPLKMISKEKLIVEINKDSVFSNKITEYIDRITESRKKYNTIRVVLEKQIDD